MLNVAHLARTDLNLLVLFLAVMEERHVGRAAERLALTPSAVSHGLGRLRRLLNDPLFLRTPRGVMPSARAIELAEPIADVLARASQVIASAEPFDAARSTRRFVIGAPDGVSAVVLPPLLARLQAVAPSIDLGVRQVLPPAPSVPGRAWVSALDDLTAREIDIAILPVDEVPPRFDARTLYEETFVIAARRGHRIAAKPTLAAYCAEQHVLVSLSADPRGFVDEALAERGASRRIAVTVPNFMMALALVAETDLLVAAPLRMVATHAERFGLRIVTPPVRLSRDHISAVATRAALMDAGVAWLFALMAEVAGGGGQGAGKSSSVRPRARAARRPSHSLTARSVR